MNPEFVSLKGGLPKLPTFKDVFSKGVKKASSKATGEISTPPINLEVAFSTAGTKAMNGFLGSFSKMANIGKIASGFKGMLTGFQGLLLTLLILVVCIAILVLIYIIVRVVRVRGFSIGHSEKLEDFMQAFHGDMNETRKLLYSLNATKENFNINGGNLIDMLHCPKTMTFLGQDEKLITQKFDTYFKYYDIMSSSLDKWFYSNEIEGFAEGKKSGDFILSGIIKEINEVRNEIREAIKKSLPKVQRILLLSSIPEKDYISGTIHNSVDKSAFDKATSYVNASKASKKTFEEFQSFTQQFIDLCIGFSVTNLYLDNYFDDIKSLHNSRRFSFFNFLIILLKPYVIELLFNNVVNKWKDLFSKKSLARSYKEFQIAWLSIGSMLGNLPKTLAGAKTDHFTDKQEDNNDKEDVIENFGFLKGLLSVGTFFMTILQVAVKIAELVTNPLEMVFFIIKMVIGLAIGLVLIIIYTLLTIPPFIWIIYGIYFFIFEIVMLAVMSLFYIVLFSFFALISCVLWVLDLILGGFHTQSIISTSMRCENPPDVWYTRANIINENIYNRAFLCQSPCSARFTPNGLLCSKLDSDQPSYCPQAQVYRIYKGLNLGSPHSMGEFKPSLKFYTKNKDQREQEVKDFFVKRQDFFQKCSGNNVKFDYLVKTICSNHEYVKLPNEKDRSKLQGLCKQIYCYGNPKEEFCYKFDDLPNGLNQKDDLDVDDVLKKIIKLIVMIIISVIVILMFLYNDSSS